MGAKLVFRPSVTSISMIRGIFFGFGARFIRRGFGLAGGSGASGFGCIALIAMGTILVAQAEAQQEATTYID